MYGPPLTSGGVIRSWCSSTTLSPGRGSNPPHAYAPAGMRAADAPTLLPPSKNCSSES